jgi:hypothetical protein
MWSCHKILLQCRETEQKATEICQDLNLNLNKNKTVHMGRNPICNTTDYTKILIITKNINWHKHQKTYTLKFHQPCLPYEELRSPTKKPQK